MKKGLTGITTLTIAAFTAIPAVSRESDKELFESVTVADLTVIDEKPATGQWSYDECVEWAVAHNTDIRQTLLQMLQAEEDIASAKDAWLPTVDFSTTHGYTNYPLGGVAADNNIYNSSYGANASWTVWEGNVRKYRLEAARLLRQQQVFAGEDIIKDLELGIMQAYLDILYAREAVEIAGKTLEVSTAQTKRMQALVESGRQSRVDLAQLESQNAQDKYYLTQAQSNLASAKLTLKKLLSLRIDSDIEIKTVNFADSEVKAPLRDMKEVYVAAQSWLPGLKSNDLSREIYAQDVKIAEATNAPNISLQGGVGTGYTTGGRDWGYQMGHRLNENVGVSLSIPIYDANKKKRAVAKAKLSEMEADISREQLLNDLSQTIESLYIQSQTARVKFESGVSQLEAMELTSQLVDRQFELGLVNPLELLTAHNNLLNARLEQLQNKYMAILASKTIDFYATHQVDLK